MRTSAGYLFMDVYQKPPLDWTDQVALLRQKGLFIESRDTYLLRTVSFHRLSPYLAIFYLPNIDKFKQNVSFTAVWQLYEFDRELRLLVSDAIERIEVAFRTALSENMSMKYGSHWFENETLFKQTGTYQRLMEKVRQVCLYERDEEIQRYYSRYHKPNYPPSWILFEKLSFGTCSNLFRNIKTTLDRRMVSDVFGYHPTIFASWIDALRYTRNLCAHHARLWNRWFVTAPILPSNSSNSEFFKRHFIAQAMIMHSLLLGILPESDWDERLFSLFQKYPEVPFECMGFQHNWEEDRFWVNNRILYAEAFSH